MKLKELRAKLSVFALAPLLVFGIVCTSLGAMGETKTTVTAEGEGLWIYPGVREPDPEVLVLRISQKRWRHFLWQLVRSAETVGNLPLPKLGPSI